MQRDAEADAADDVHQAAEDPPRSVGDRVDLAGRTHLDDLVDTQGKALLPQPEDQDRGELRGRLGLGLAQQVGPARPVVSWYRPLEQGAPLVAEDRAVVAAVELVEVQAAGLAEDPLALPTGQLLVVVLTLQPLELDQLGLAVEQPVGA